MKEFIWQPDWKMKRKKKPSVNMIKFGDGYEQRQQNGINNNLRTYDVTFTGAEQRVSEIERFLSEHRGVHAFLWTPYGDIQGRFICQEWEETKETGFSTLATTFVEVVA